MMYSQLKPYVSLKVKLSREQRDEIYGKLPEGGLTPEHYYATGPRSRETTVEPITRDESDILTLERTEETEGKR